MTISENFEHFQYFNFEADFLENENFFNEEINSVECTYYTHECTYYTHEECVSFSSNLNENFSIMHLNIRSLHENIDKLKDFLNDIKGKFSVIVLSETWIDDDKADLNSLFHIPNYSFIH